MLSQMTYLLHPPSQLLRMLTYLRPNSSDPCPAVSVCLGGGCWCCYHCPLAHIRLRCYLCPAFPLQCGCLSRNHIQSRSREPVHMGSARFFRFPCSYPNWYFLRRIPDCRLRWTLFLLKGQGRP